MSSSSHRGGGGGGGGRGGGGGGGSRSLLSGKAKKELMREKREKERVHADKVAAWEKRQQLAVEADIQQRAQQQMHMQQTQPQPPQPPPRHSGSDESDEALAVRRAPPSSSSSSTSSPSSSSFSSSSSAGPSAVPVFAAVESTGAEVRNKLRTLFATETKEEIERRKRESRRPLQRSGPVDGSCPSIDPWLEAIDIPTRPAWSPSMSAAALHEQEARYFTSYLQLLYGRYPTHRLNHFEHNLEVWRQLWRVCEQSHVLLLIVDSRYPLINFPPSLHRYVTLTLHKPLVLVLNKVDLIPRRVVHAWMDYFRLHHPTLHVVAYSSQPKGREGSSEAFDVLVRNRPKQPGGGMVLAEAYGVGELLDAVRKVVRESGVDVDEEVKSRFSFEPTAIDEAEGGQISIAHTGDARTAERPKGEEAKEDGGGGGEDEGQGEEEERLPKAAKQSRGKQRGKRTARRRQQRAAAAAAHEDSGEEEEEEGNASDEAANEEEEELEEEEAGVHSRYRQLLGQLEDQPPSSLSFDPTSSTSSSPTPSLSRSYLTIGTLGTPNAGKSSLINSLARRKLVSVSKTPGHTKYLQTLFLNPHTRLCDCPGLVFPAVDLPKALQTLAGSFPIAQTRDPYSAVRLLAERVPLEKVYKLRPTPVDERGEYTYAEGEEGEGGWEWTAWSICEAFAYQKGYRNRHGVLDLYRAANAICRDALEGVVVLYTTPPPEDRAAENSPLQGARESKEGQPQGGVGAARRAPSGGRSRGTAASSRVADEGIDGGQREAPVTTAGRGQKGQGRRRRQEKEEDE